MELISNMFNIKKNAVVGVILFFINPILVILHEVLSCKKKAMNVTIFALSFALIISYYPIMFDTASNFYVYFYNQHKEIFDLYSFFPSFFRPLGCNYISIIFIYIFIIVYCWTKICFSSWCETDKNVNKFIFILILLCTFNYRDLMDLNRNILSFSLVYFYILYFCNRYKKLSNYLFIPFLVVTLYIHISTAVIWFVFFISKFFRMSRRMAYFILIICSLIGFVLPVLMPLLEKTVSLLPGVIGERLSFYLFGTEFGVQNFSIGQALQKMLNFAVIFLIGIHSIREKKSDNRISDRYFNFFIMNASLTLICLMYLTLFERYNLSMNFIYGYLLIKNYRKSLFSNLIVFLIVFRSLVINLVVYFPILFFNNAQVFDDTTDILSFAFKPFYSNTIYLLDHDNGYDDKYLSKHLFWGR